jgi:hypothetical protein
MKRRHRGTENTETTEKTVVGGLQKNLRGLGVLRVSVVKRFLWK